MGVEDDALAGAESVGAAAAAGGVAMGADGELDALGARDDWTFVRCASGRSAAAGGVHASTFVNERAGAWAAASGATTDSCRTGSSAVAGSAAGGGAAFSAGAAATGDGDGPAGDGAGAASGARPAWRWTGRSTSEACDVSDATLWTGADTSPAGASDVTSWPSWPTIGGNGRAPGTSARNVRAGATTGGAPVTRWIGGKVDHAPVGRASRDTGAAAGADEGTPASFDSGEAGAASERPNGHGRRTLTPPQTVVC